MIVSAASTIKLELLVRSVSITRLGNITQSHLPSRVSLRRRRQHIFEILHLFIRSNDDDDSFMNLLTHKTRE